MQTQVITVDATVAYKELAKQFKAAYKAAKRELEAKKGLSPAATLRLKRLVDTYGADAIKVEIDKLAEMPEIEEADGEIQFEGTDILDAPAVEAKTSKKGADKSGK